MEAPNGDGRSATAAPSSPCPARRGSRSGGTRRGRVATREAVEPRRVGRPRPATLAERQARTSLGAPVPARLPRAGRVRIFGPMSALTAPSPSEATPPFVAACERILADAEATAAWGARLAPNLRAGDAVLLEGPMGAGKSHLARAVIRARTTPDEEVPSPSYTLVQLYEARDGTAIWHADLHRLSGPDEAWELGLVDAFAEAISLVEWPDRLGFLAPPDALRLTLVPEEGGRRLVVRSNAPRWAGIEALLDG